MRSLILILGGLMLLGLSLGSARLLLGGQPAPLRLAALVFTGFWFLAAAGNLWIGVTRAGYPLAAELPIFLLVFGVPAAAALAFRRRCR